MSGSDQLSVCGSAHIQDDTEPMFGIGPRIHRIFEFAAAATGVILLAPIFLMTSIAIKLNSRGPIFIREPQFGRSNRVIQVFKFRFVESSIWQRPTWAGLALNGTGVDQLPQLFNVLRGEMSIGDLLRAIRRGGVFLP
jgi:polysaccharide biosynthesis protein PslA